MSLFNYANLIDPILKDVRVCVSELSEIKPGEKIIDVCCGTGDQAFYYAAKGAIATGIDRNFSIPGICEKNREKPGFNSVNFIKASATELPFGDGYFDCASISLGLHEMVRNQRQSVVSEVKRVVKNAGILIFADFKVPLPKNQIGYLIRAIEFAVGVNNFRSFRDYLDQGGLEQILKENFLYSQSETILKLNCFQIVKSINL